MFRRRLGSGQGGCRTGSRRLARAGVRACAGRECSRAHRLLQRVTDEVHRFTDCRCRVVVLCRPHNPTGTLEPVDEVERFLRRVPGDTIVLLDEAYIEFVAPEYRLDGLSLIQRFPNLLVVRTFSKAYGLAGLRIGYGFGSAELTRKLWQMQLPFGMGITSLVGRRGLL